MDIGRIGLFGLLAAISIYYGLKNGRTSMMILGVIIAVVGVLNVLLQNRNKKEDDQNK